MRVVLMRAMTLAAVAAAWLIQVPTARGDVITSLGSAVTENFDTLAMSGTSSLLPKDWKISESPSSADQAYTAGTGSSLTGDTYSFGATSSSERALGSLASSTLQSTFGSKYTNSTGRTINFLRIAFDGEQWRSGGPSSGSQKLDFQYSLNATSLTTGTWIDVNSLDILSLINNAAAGALDGNLAANRASYSSVISGLAIAPGSIFWVRFVDTDDPSFDHALAADNFSVTADAVPEPSGFVLGIIGTLVAAARFARRRVSQHDHLLLP